MSITDRSMLRRSPNPPRASDLGPSASNDQPAAYQWQTVRSLCACGVEIVTADNPGMIQAAVTAHNSTPVHRLWRSEQDAVNRLRRTIPVKQCPCHGGDHQRDLL